MQNRIRELRKQKGITMKQLGSALGLAESTISQYETGKRDPDLKTLFRISQYFGVRMEDIVGLETFDTGEEFLARWKEITSSASGEQLTVSHRANGETVIVDYKNHDKLVNLYDSLNLLGKSVAIERLEELSEIPKYQNKPPQDK